jgi:hypothetical protein
MVDASPQPGAPRIGHRVLVVKIDSHLKGAEGLTHLRIGWVPTARQDPAVGRTNRGERPSPELKEGRKMLFFLAKHPDGAFFVIPNTLDPVDATDPTYKAQVDVVSQSLSAAADPKSALSARNAQTRFQAALSLITNYRMHEGTRNVESVPIAAEESRLILRALAEGDWTTDPTGVRLSGFIGIYRLGLSEADGWQAPGGKQMEEYTETMRKAYITWLAGPGKDYAIKKVVPKE